MLFRSEGEARMGDFADGPDLPDRLQWAKALHIHCTLSSSDITLEIDIQLHVYSLVQALQECQAKVLQASERSAHLVKIAKTSQLKEDMYQKLKEGAVTLAKLQHLSPQKTNNCTKKYGNSVRRITPIF